MRIPKLAAKISIPKSLRWHLRRLHHEAFHIALGPCDLRVSEIGPKAVRDVAKVFNTMADAIQALERSCRKAEKLAATGRRAVMITHEVRNPLSSIGLNIELLQVEIGVLEGDRTEAEGLCGAIVVEIERLTEITEEYLRLSRDEVLFRAP